MAGEPAVEHACPGPECRICGEPEELRRMRWNIRKALFNNSDFDMPECSDLARIAARAIREDVTLMIEVIEDLKDELYSTRNGADNEA